VTGIGATVISGLVVACAVVLARPSSAADKTSRALTAQQLRDYANSPLEPITSPRSFVLGTWGGAPVQVELGCTATCPTGEQRLIYLAGVEIDSCDGAGAVLEQRLRPGRAETTALCVPQPIWFDEQLASQPRFSDRSLADFATARDGPTPENGSVVGSYRGALVRMMTRCSPFSCSERILYLEPRSDGACEQVGGVTRKLAFYGDFVTTYQVLCTPTVLDER
jgi:hypothetical protein